MSDEEPEIPEDLRCPVCGSEDRQRTRIKDLQYGDNAQWTVTIYISHCGGCGEIICIG